VSPRKRVLALLTGRLRLGPLLRIIPHPDMAHRDQTAWLGWEDSNSEMSTQIISLKDRIDLRESSRILAVGETIRV
jgi:hypothetical protein